MAEISIDGGVIEINADNAELFSGFVAGSVSLESGGAWFDTLGNDAGTSLGLIGVGELTKSGAGELTLSGASTYAGGTTVSQGTLRIDGGSISHAAANTVVGRLAGDNGTLVIANGGTVSNQGSVLGDDAGATGTATVTGAGSAWNNGGDVFVGNGGAGTLTLVDGGRVNAVGIFALANNAGSTGTLNLGAGGAAGVLDTASVNGGAGVAVLNFNHSDADYRFTRDGTASGTEVLITGSTAVNHIGSGATTLTGVHTYTGGTTVSQGTLRLDGGSISHAAANTVVGRLAGDNGTLVVENGGTMTNNLGVIGDQAGSAGSVEVRGSGSLWDIHDYLRVGESGTGTLTVADGGVVATSWRGDVGIGSGSSGAVTVTGAGSTWSSGVGITLGTNGAGVLTVAEGGRVAAPWMTLSFAPGSSSGTLNIGAGGEAGVVDTTSVFGWTSGAVVNFNHSDADYRFTRDGTASGTEVLITGSTAVNHIGSGATTLTGAHTYTGGTFVQSGTLRVNGTLTSDTFVNAGGTLGGSGTLGNVTVHAGGRLAPGNSPGILTVAGDLTLASGSVTEMEIDGPIPGTQHDQINVSGTATLDGTLNLVLGAPLADGDSFNLINAGSLVLAGDPATGFANITGNFGAALVPTPVIGLTTFDIVFNQGSFVAATPGSLTFNQRNVARALDALAASGQAPALVAQANQLAAAALPPAFDAWSGEQHTLAQTLAVKTGQAFHGAVVKCLDDTPESATLGRTVDPARARGCGLWGELTGGVGDIDGDANAHGADYRGGGFTFGVDTELGKNLIVGAALGYARTDIDPVAGDLEVESVQGALYGGWRGDAWYARASAGFGAHDFDADRRVAVGAVGGTANADYEAWTATGGFEIGRRSMLGGARVTPFAGLEYNHLRRERFSEHGASAADLDVASERADSLRAVLGARLASRFATASGMKIAPVAEVAWVRETLDDDARLTAAFAGTTGATFRIKGPELDRGRARLSAGVTAQLTKTADLHVGYAGEIADSDAGHAFSAGFRMAW